MRINQFVAQATGLSRRSIDQAIKDGRVLVNEKPAVLGQDISINDLVTLDSKLISRPKSTTTILLNKPVGYVCSRDGQGSPTIYSLIPSKYQSLKHVGRLDKDSSGLVVLTNDGKLANELTHPSFEKVKVYTVKLNETLKSVDQKIIESGKVKLDGKPSLMKIDMRANNSLEVRLSEGRNRQIRRTFKELNYEVISLRRDSIGQFSLSQLGSNPYLEIRV